jgi:hypothetical protein
MNQNLWKVLQTLLEKNSIGTTELALARESLSSEFFTALVEYLQDGLKAKGNPWVVRLINIVGKSESFKKLSRKLGIT